ncbi:MAG: ATPase V [Gemmatimonadota bacterium]|nr:MAG: ATPase V [Gemmatimonadota bacterium]
MAIVPLSKLTLVGHQAEKDRVLEDLQELGCLEIVSLAPEAAPLADPSKQSREVLSYLDRCPQKQRPLTISTDFDPVRVEAEVLALKDRIHRLELERDTLMHRIEALAPWGDFDFPPAEDLAGRRLWFYVVPRNRVRELAASGLIWEDVRRDGRNAFVIVISESEPQGVPAPRVRTGKVSRRKLERRLHDVELELDDAYLERVRLTRWRVLLSRSLDALEDRAVRNYAAGQCYDSDPVFALRAWAPIEALDTLGSYAEEHGMAMEISDPGPEDKPPTLLRNTERREGGEDLVNFYKTPRYGSWDPSGVVLYSFAIFFAMIISDGGYGLILALIVSHYWKRLSGSAGGRRWRWVLFTLAAATIGYGILIGSFFGVAPGPGSLAARFVILDMADTTTMMGLSIAIGVLHVLLGNLMDAGRHGWSPRALPSLGWAMFVLGGYTLYLGARAGADAVRTPATAAAVGGLFLVLAFAGYGARPLARLGKGLAAMTRITAAFGDVLSYLRLFALGLASASLAISFNGMAASAWEGIPGVGILAALAILVIGHSLNLLLAVAGGFIHGLRLNVIEFLNWGLPEEGSLFRPFKKKGA